MNNKIIEIINDWNPIEIYPLLEKEYFYEIKRVLQSSDIQTVGALTNVIYIVFSESFGKQFTKTIDECEKIAEQLIDFI